MTGDLHARVIGPLFGLFVVGWLGRAEAQPRVFRPSGVELTEEAQVDGFSLGFQAVAGEEGVLFEHPLVLTRRLTHASPPLLAALVAEEASETGTLAPVLTGSMASTPPTATLESPRLSSYTLDLKTLLDAATVEVKERLALSYSALSLQDAPPVSISATQKAFPAIEAVRLESPQLEKLGSAALGNIVSLSLSFNRDSSDPDRLIFRAETVQITRRAQTDSRSPQLADLVRNGVAIDELVIVGLNKNLRLWEIRLRGVAFVQYRLAGEGTRTTEQIGLTVSSFELVTLKDGKSRAGVATVAFAK